jgi:hypothetical protein
MLSGSQPTIRDELIREFGPNIGKSSDVLERLERISKTYNCPAETLAAKWEAHVINMSSDGQLLDKSVPTDAYLEQLQSSLHKEHDAKLNERLGLGSKPGSSFLIRRDRDVDRLSDGLLFDNDSLGDLLNVSFYIYLSMDSRFIHQ